MGELKADRMEIRKGYRGDAVIRSGPVDAVDAEVGVAERDDPREFGPEAAAVHVHIPPCGDRPDDDVILEPVGIAAVQVVMGIDTTSAVGIGRIVRVEACMLDLIEAMAGRAI